MKKEAKKLKFESLDEAKFKMLSKEKMGMILGGRCYADSGKGSETSDLGSGGTVTKTWSSDVTIYDDKGNLESTHYVNGGDMSEAQKKEFHGELKPCNP